MNILITGGAGFIGTNLAHHFSQEHNVTILDNLSRKGVDKNLDFLKKNSSNITYLIKDVLDEEAVNNAVKDQHVIFHQAGQTAVTTSLVEPLHDFNVNARGTFNLLEAIRNNNQDAILIYASTNKVYGDLHHLQITEDETRYRAQPQAISEAQSLDFHSPYGCSKGAADQYVLDYARSYGLKTVVFRQSCIYGEHQFGVEDQGWVAHFAIQVLENNPITIFGDGKQVRDILYIKDLVSAYHAAVKHIDTTQGQAYNIGGGYKNSISLLECLSLLEKTTGKAPDISFAKARVGDQKYYVSDTTKAHKDFGWQPVTPIDRGINKLVNWLDT